MTKIGKAEVLTYLKFSYDKTNEVLENCKIELVKSDDSARMVFASMADFRVFLKEAGFELWIESRSGHPDRKAFVKRQYIFTGGSV